MPNRHPRAVRNTESAQTSLVLAVKDRLPEAFEEVRREPLLDLTIWAKRWNLNAKCIVGEAETIAKLSKEGFFDEGNDIEVDHVIPAKEPPAWIEELRRIDSLPLSMTGQAVGDRVTRPPS